MILFLYAVEIVSCCQGTEVGFCSIGRWQENLRAVLIETKGGGKKSLKGEKYKVIMRHLMCEGGQGGHVLKFRKCVIFGFGNVKFPNIN